jgi:hypothetical protein
MTTKETKQLAQQVKNKLKVQNDELIIAELMAMGFSDEYVQVPRRLVVSLSGKEKTGKTHFALTAPEPIFFINVDIGTEGVVNKFQDSGKKIYIYDLRVPKTAVKDVYVPMWENFKTLMHKVYSVKHGTVVIDTDTETYELARLAKFGKLSQIMPQHYTEVNNEYREILRLAYDSPMNSVFIHKMKPKYINNVRTLEYEPSGFGDMEYNSQVNLICYRDDSGGSPEFSVFVKDCRQSPNVNGEYLRGGMCNFEFLLSLVHG